MLNDGFWGARSPFAPTASGVHQICRVPSLSNGRLIWCRGIAEATAAQFLILTGVGGRISEQPVELTWDGGKTVPDFLQERNPGYSTNFPTDWDNTTIWEAKDTSVFDNTTPELRWRPAALSHLHHQIKGGRALADYTGATYRVMIIELAGRSLAPPIDRLTRDLSCSVVVLRRTTVTNLQLMWSHYILFPHRDEDFLTKVVNVFDNHQSALTIEDVSRYLSAPIRKTAEYVLHAACHNLLAFDLNKPFGLGTTLFFRAMSQHEYASGYWMLSPRDCGSSK